MGIKFWICICLIVISCVFMLVNKKIRCTKLFRDLLKIFYDNRNGKTSWFDILTFFICPIILGTAIVVGFEYYFSKEVSNALLTIFSILFTLLFGVMSLLTSTLDSRDTTKRKISNEAFTAVAFAMFSSLVSLIVLIVYIVLLEKITQIICFQIITGVILAIAINMMILFFMIIKRSYITSTISDNSN